MHKRQNVSYFETMESDGAYNIHVKILIKAFCTIFYFESELTENLNSWLVYSRNTL